jgi:hypothetical protein
MMCGVMWMVAISVGKDIQQPSILLRLRWCMVVPCSIAIVFLCSWCLIISAPLCVDPTGQRTVAWNRRHFRCSSYGPCVLAHSCALSISLLSGGVFLFFGGRLPGFLVFDIRVPLSWC